MGIRVARGLRTRIIEDPGSIVVHVRVQQAADADAAGQALRAARADIAALTDPDGDPGEPGVKFVSGVVPTPAGPCLTVDAGHLPGEVAATIPDILARHLAAAGVGDAVIASPQRTDTLGGLPRAVLLRLYPPPPPVQPGLPPAVELPAGWLHAARDWLAARCGPDGTLLAETVPMTFALPLAAVDGFLARRRRAEAITTPLIAGDPATRIRAVNVCFLGPVPNLALAAGGPKAREADLLADLDALVAIGRQLAPQAGYAFATVDPTFAGFRSRSHPTDWAASDAGGMRSGPGSSDQLLDEVALDAFWWQALGPGHLGRLGGPPSGARPLGNGRVEVAVGDPADWLFERPPEGPQRNHAKFRRDPWVYARARELLAPCLLTKHQASRLTRSRLTGQPPPP